MTIRLWKIEDDGEAYDALSAEQKQFADFIWKMDWEGGIDGLLGHSGTEYFPDSLKVLASKLDATMNELNAAINALGKELEVEW